MASSKRIITVSGYASVTAAKLINYLKRYYYSDSRLKSWEHCYESFSSAKKSGVYSVDCLALQLGFYLASWGMYRGSSFLIKFDYTIHKGAVDIALCGNYDDLFDGKLWQTNRSRYVSLIKEVYDELYDHYSIYYKRVRKGSVSGPSDTLISKIILGIFGAIPAYDRFFSAGMKALGYKGTITPHKADLAAVDICDIADKLLPEIAKIKSSGILPSIYTDMKILDMLIFLFGAEIISAGDPYDAYDNIED